MSINRSNASKNQLYKKRLIHKRRFTISEIEEKNQYHGKFVNSIEKKTKDIMQLISLNDLYTCSLNLFMTASKLLSLKLVVKARHLVCVSLSSEANT